MPLPPQVSQPSARVPTAANLAGDFSANETYPCVNVKTSAGAQATPVWRMISGNATSATACASGAERHARGGGSGAASASKGNHALTQAA